MLSKIAHRLYVGDLHYDFVGKRNRWYLVSGVLITICVLALVVRGLNMGIEFRGGSDFKAPIAVQTDTVEKTRAAIEELKLPDVKDVQVTTIGNNTVRVQTQALNVEEVSKVKETLAKLGDTKTDDVAYSLVGASWGSQVTNQGLVALLWFLGLVMILIWVYFRDFKMSISAIVALIHDLILTVGAFAIFGFTVTPATLIGVLTILGYSLYDTVVVFDKVRDNVLDLEESNITYSEAASRSVNQVLIRSINTSIIGVLPVAALLFCGVFVLGSGPLGDLGLALFVVMLAGAYSSIFIATPFLAQMKEHEPKWREHAQRLARRQARREARGKEEKSDAKVAVGSASEMTAELVESPEVPAVRQPRVRKTRAQRTGKKS